MSALSRLRAVLTNDPAVHDELRQENLDHLRQHVEECRQGDFEGLECIETGLRFCEIEAEEIGTTIEEVEEFRSRFRAVDLELAEQYLAEARGGDILKMKPLRDLLDGPTRLDDLGLEEAEYEELVRQYHLTFGKQVVQECREGDFTRFRDLVRGLGMSLFAPQELDTTFDEIARFKEEQFIVPARRYLEEAKAGDFENVKRLGELLNSGKVSEAELDVDQAELNGFLKGYYREGAEKFLAECRSGDYDHRQKLEEIFELGYLSYQEMGTSRDEVRGFEVEACLAEAKKIADACRDGDFRDLELLTAFVERGLEISELTQEQVDELDLDLEGWARRSEAAELSRMFARARGLGAEILDKYTAEELDLTEEQHSQLVELCTETDQPAEPASASS